MNDLNKLKKATHLHGNVIWELASDLLYETDSVSWSKCSERHLVAWFLRNYLHMSFNQITALVDYSEGSAAEAVRALDNESADPVDLRGEYNETLSSWKHLCSQFYGVEGNVMLYRCSDELRDSLLWSANGNGMSDKYNRLNNQWYAPTPKNPPSLFNTLVLIEAYESGEQDFFNNFNVKQTY